MRGSWRGKFRLDMECCSDTHSGVSRDYFRLIEDPRSRVTSPVASPDLADPADSEIGLSSYADRALFVRSVRGWIDDYPRKSRWTFTRDQVRAILSVLDSVIDE